MTDRPRPPLRTACFCMGPQPGHDLCPCRERRAAAERAKTITDFLRRNPARNGRIREN